MGKNLRQIIDYQIKGLPLKIMKFKGQYEEIFSPPHFHIFEIEIQFFIDGDGYYFIKNRRYKIEKGKVLIIHRKDLHYFINPEEKKPIEKITVMMKKDLLGENIKFLRKIFKCEEIHQVFFNERDFIISKFLLEEILEIIGRKKIKKEDIFTIKLNLSKFFYILEKAIKNFQRKEKISSFDERINKAIEFINKNYFNRIRVEEICKELNISKYHFSHIFKKFTGLSFRKYLLERRLFESKKMLIETNLKLNIIARKCGFFNLPFFFREFKNKYGLTPNQYRRLIKVR
ncbi:MAG: helix-turn-helix domain-containing protein [Candidatus Omnitrophica bacterium]|nr:helix-turn-helix domain-containing protein [Candidatus Omnitrophota bacterium]